MYKSLMYTVTLLLLTSPCFAAADKWGGDDRVRNPTSLYQTGTSTATGEFTLTDSTKAWATNSLAGSILQPSTAVEVYYLIKSNTGTEITVYGNDADGHDEECHRHIHDDNAGTGAYAILDRWSVQKVSSRWWLFDPYGNAYWIKSVNNLGTHGAQAERRGYSIDNVAHTTLINSQAWGGNGTDANGYAGNIFNGVVDTVKSIGFNTLGSTQDPYRMDPGSCYNPSNKTAARLMPFIGQIKVDSLTLSNVPTFTVNGGTIWDAMDADFQTDIETALVDRLGSTATAYEGYSLFGEGGCSNRASWSAYLLTPYSNAKYNVAANPYFIGYDWDEERPYVRSEEDNEHMGYRILISASGTARKTAAITYLQTVYATISDLNTAWGSSFADWAALDADTGTVINTLLTKEPYCRDYGTYDEGNNAMKADLDGIAEDFWRTFTKGVYDALNTVTGAHMLNFGPAYHGWSGNSGASFNGITSPEYLFRGSVSADAATAYVDIIAIGDPLHGAHTAGASTNFYENMGADLRSYYTFHGRPYYHESCWLTAEADSAISHTGTVTDLAATLMTDSTNPHFDGDGVDYPNFQSGGSAPYRMLALDVANHAPGSRCYYSINGTGVTDTTIGAYQELCDSTWSWNGSPDMTTYGAGGNTYHFISHDSFGHIATGSYALYVPLTQAIRGTMYAKFVSDASTFTATSGDYIVVGYSNWEWFDFSFRNSTAEFRNFGFMTTRGNLYDGSATIANGEVQDCGDFVTPVTAALNSIYNNRISVYANRTGGSITGGMIR